MKKIILFIAFTGLILNTNAQNILKLKTVNTDYGEVIGNQYHRIDKLDGAVINPDSLSFLFPDLSVVNISNDTFFSNVRFEQTMFFLLYADTGLLLVDKNVSQRYYIDTTFLPNDTLSLGLLTFSLIEIIDYLKEEENIELEQISYWKMITGISYTSKDGTYSEDVFYEGADTSTFYITRTPVNIKERKNELTNPISVFPNPAQSQFTVTNTENANIQLYNLLGQKVKQITSTEENTVIQTDNLPAGIYVLKVEKGNSVFMKKVQVIK